MVSCKKEEKKGLSARPIEFGNGQLGLNKMGLKIRLLGLGLAWVLDFRELGWACNEAYIKVKIKLIINHK